jgi:hypothetical protein
MYSKPSAAMTCVFNVVQNSWPILEAGHRAASCAACIINNEKNISFLFLTCAAVLYTHATLRAARYFVYSGVELYGLHSVQLAANFAAP